MPCSSVHSFRCACMYRKILSGALDQFCEYVTSCCHQSFKQVPAVRIPIFAVWELSQCSALTTEPWLLNEPTLIPCLPPCMAVHPINHWALAVSPVITLGLHKNSFVKWLFTLMSVHHFAQLCHVMYVLYYDLGVLHYCHWVLRLLFIWLFTASLDASFLWMIKMMMMMTITMNVSKAVIRFAKV